MRKITPARSASQRLHRPAVALLIETSNAYARGLLAGINAFVRQHATWSIYLPEQGRGAHPPGWLARWQGDGVIARLENAPIAKAVMKIGVPVVDVSAARTVPTVPWVETDDAAISRLALQHFLDRGFRQVAFCGERGFNWSQWREDAFLKAAAEQGCRTFRFAVNSSARHTWGEQHRRLTEWVRSLPRPIGVMACFDRLGQQLLDACRDAGVSVPEEVAVVGVDDDDVLCNLCTPPLSSVRPDTFRAGFLAAELLQRMMAGQRVSAAGHFVPPVGLTTRQSSDVLAIEEPEMATAWRFIREQACTGIKVTDVLAVVPLSRRVLENRFRRLFGRTPHEEIERLRIERAQQLLTETDLSLAAIAQRVGFEHPEYLSVAFKRTTGHSPRDFRRAHSR
jgi:LacI family transcriptional regulator